MSEKECGNCRHWEPAPWNRGEKEDDCELGECRRFPPTIHLFEKVRRYEQGSASKINDASLFPITPYVQVCGEWSLK